MSRSTGSRVVPACSLTTTRSSPKSRLTNEDLPALGLPTTATRTSLAVRSAVPCGKAREQRVEEIAHSPSRGGADRVRAAGSQRPEIEMRLLDGKAVHLVSRRAAPAFRRGATSAPGARPTRARLPWSRPAAPPRFASPTAVIAWRWIRRSISRFEPSTTPPVSTTRKTAPRPLRLSKVAIARHAGRVVDDGGSSSDRPVEEGGLADVGSAHDRDHGKTHVPSAASGRPVPVRTTAGANARLASASSIPSTKTPSAFRASPGSRIKSPSRGCPTARKTSSACDEARDRDRRPKVLVLHGHDVDLGARPSSELRGKALHEGRHGLARRDAQSRHAVQGTKPALARFEAVQESPQSPHPVLLQARAFVVGGRRGLPAGDQEEFRRRRSTKRDLALSGTVRARPRLGPGRAPPRRLPKAERAGFRLCRVSPTGTTDKVGIPSPNA